MSHVGTPAPNRAAVVRATLLVVVSACCFGTIAPLTVVATAHGMTLESVQTIRYGGSALLLVLLGVLRPLAPLAAGESPWYAPRRLLVAGGGQALIATLALSALRFIPAATEAFLFYTFPAWVTLLSALRGIEPIDRTRALALVLSLGGLAIMVGAPDAAALHPTGLILALSAALVYALYIPMLGSLQRGREPLDVSRSIAVGGTVVFATWAASTGSLLVIPDATAFAASSAQGVLTAASFLSFLSGLRVLGAVRTAITSTVEPFWTALLGVLLLSQPLGVSTLLGGAAIMAAVGVLQLRVES